MDLFINKDASSSGGMASYSKKGMRWSFGFSSRTPDPKHLAGAYEIVGDELVKRDQTGGVGFDGCKEFDSEEAFFSKKRNYFYIDICKGE